MWKFQSHFFMKDPSYIRFHDSKSKHGDMTEYSSIRNPFPLKTPLNPVILKVFSFPPPKGEMMTSSVSVVMEACGAGSLETIRGWNMLNGFPGKCFPSI